PVHRWNHFRLVQLFEFRFQGRSDSMAPQLKRADSGQASTELILILVVLVTAVLAVSTAFRNEEYFATLVSGPWRSLQGLIQNGTYGSPDDTMSRHPSRFERAASARGDNLQ